MHRCASELVDIEAATDVYMRLALSCKRMTKCVKVACTRCAALFAPGLQSSCPLLPVSMDRSPGGAGAQRVLRLQTCHSAASQRATLSRGGREAQVGLSFSDGLEIDRNTSRRLLQRLRQSLRWEDAPVITGFDPRYNQSQPLWCAPRRRGPGPLPTISRCLQDVLCARAHSGHDTIPIPASLPVLSSVLQPEHMVALAGAGATESGACDACMAAMHHCCVRASHA